MLTTGRRRQRDAAGADGDAVGRDLGHAGELADVAHDVDLVADGDVESRRGVDEDAVGCRGVAVTRVLQVVAVEAAGLEVADDDALDLDRVADGRGEVGGALHRADRHDRRFAVRLGRAALRGSRSRSRRPGVFRASPADERSGVAGDAGEVEVVAHPVGGACRCRCRRGCAMRRRGRTAGRRRRRRASCRRRSGRRAPPSLTAIASTSVTPAGRSSTPSLFASRSLPSAPVNPVTSRSEIVPFSSAFAARSRATRPSASGAPNEMTSSTSAEGRHVSPRRPRSRARGRRSGRCRARRAARRTRRRCRRCSPRTR